MKSWLVFLAGLLAHKASSAAVKAAGRTNEAQPLLGTEELEPNGEEEDPGQGQSQTHLSRNKRSIFTDMWLYDAMSSQPMGMGSYHRSPFYDVARPAFSAADHRMDPSGRYNKRSAYAIPDSYRIFPAKNRFRGNVNCKVWAWKTPRACRYV